MNNLLIIFFIALNSISAFELEVYRMVGIESEQNWTGSKVASFQMLTTHWQNIATRKVGLIKFSEINENSIAEFLTNKPNGVLIILDQVDEENKTWDLITKHLGPRGSTIPIYFTYDSEIVSNHYSELLGNSEQEYQLQVSSVDQKLTLNLEDSYNLLESIAGFKQNNPSTLLVLGLDVNLPSAEIQIPIEKFGQQISIFFRMAKELKYQQKQNRNVIFYISTSMTIDEYGLKLFLKKQEYQRIVSTIDSVVILGEINQNSVLIIEHNSELKENIQQQVTDIQHQLLESEALTIANKEINTLRVYTDQSVSILSTKNSTIVQDNQQITLNLISQLIDNTNFVAQHDDQLFDQALNQFMNQVNRHPSNLQKDSKFSNDLYAFLRQIFKHTTKVQYSIKDKKFYTSSQLKGQIIKFYSAFIDLYLIVGVGIWLTLIFGVTKVICIQSQYVPLFRDVENVSKKKK